MSIGILIITHSGVGSALLATAGRLLRSCPLRIRCLDIPLDADTDTLLSRAEDNLHNLDDGEGVLILTDLYGATPSNIASHLNRNNRVAVVTGINLPMLMRIINYSTEDLDSLIDKAVGGGIRGIQTIQPQSSEQL